jgi:pentatricopeptide repeat protein
MQSGNVKPNQVTIVSVLPACADVAALQEGKYIHEYIMKNKFELDIFVGNSLLSMYAKCKRIDIALQLFDKMSKKKCDLMEFNDCGIYSEWTCQ